MSYNSVLALNSILLSSPESLTTQSPFIDILPETISKGITSSSTQLAENSVLAAGKYLLVDPSSQEPQHIEPIITTLANTINPSSGSATDTRRLSLVVIRTICRTSYTLLEPYLATLIPPVFASVRDPVIPVKLAAEQAFLALLQVVQSEADIFDKYIAEQEAAGKLDAARKRSMSDYFRRVAMRLGAQARERKEAEGGAGGLGLSSDEVDDEREVWSVGKVEIGEGWRDE